MRDVRFGVSAPVFKLKASVSYAVDVVRGIRYSITLFSSALNLYIGCLHCVLLCLLFIYFTFVFYNN